jgi:hypothetical protein
MRRKTLQIYGKVSATNKFTATLRVPFIADALILKAYSFHIEGISTQAKTDLIYLLRSNIINENNNVMCHFNIPVATDTGGNILSLDTHDSCDISFNPVDNIDGDYEFFIGCVNSATPTDPSTWTLGYAITLEAVQYDKK